VCALLWLLLPQNKYRGIPGTAVFFHGKYRGRNLSTAHPYYAVRVLAQCLVKRKTANNEYMDEYLASKTKINNTGIFVTILAPVSAQLIRTSN